MIEDDVARVVGAARVAPLSRHNCYVENTPGLRWPFERWGRPCNECERLERACEWTSWGACLETNRLAGSLAWLTARPQRYEAAVLCERSAYNVSVLDLICVDWTDGQVEGALNSASLTNLIHGDGTERDWRIMKGLRKERAVEGALFPLPAAGCALMFFDGFRHKVDVGSENRISGEEIWRASGQPLG
jgi:hypothetical protein